MATKVPSGGKLLLRAGRSAGPTLRGTAAFYPALKTIKEDTVALLAKNGCELPSDAVAIGLRQGYQAFWMSSTTTSTAITMYQEGDPEPHQEWTSFPDSLASMIHQVDRR